MLFVYLHWCFTSWSFRKIFICIYFPEVFLWRPPGCYLIKARVLVLGLMSWAWILRKDAPCVTPSRRRRPRGVYITSNPAKLKYYGRNYSPTIDQKLFLWVHKALMKRNKANSPEMLNSLPWEAELQLDSWQRASSSTCGGKQHILCNWFNIRLNETHIVNYGTIGVVRRVMLFKSQFHTPADFPQSLLPLLI